MTTKWNLNETQSDVLIQTKDKTITYLGGNTNHFNGFVSMEEDEIEDAAVEFSLDSKSFSSKKKNLALKKSSDKAKKPFLRFKSTSFQKIKNNINFFKGQLTIKNVTKIVELEAEFVGINNLNGNRKAAFEIKGDINRNDFGIDKNFNPTKENFGFGRKMQLIANLEFSI